MHSLQRLVGHLCSVLVDGGDLRNATASQLRCKIRVEAFDFGKKSQLGFTIRVHAKGPDRRVELAEAPVNLRGGRGFAVLVIHYDYHEI